MESRTSEPASAQAFQLKTGSIVVLCGLLTTGQAFAQTPTQELDDNWRNICENVDPDSDLGSQCDLIINAGPGSGGRISAAAAGNNLGVISAQSRASTTGARIQKKNIESRLDEEDDENGGGASAEMNFGRLSLFVTANYTDTERDPSDFETGYDEDLYGATFGADYRYSDQVAAGLALGYSDSDADFDRNAGGLDTENISLLAYGNFRPGENFYLDAYLGYAWLDFDSTRNIDYDLVINAGTPDEDTVSVSTVANGDTDGDQWFGGINLGYDRVSGAWTLSPQVSIDFIETDIDSYAESGGSGLAQSYGDQSISSLTASLGAQVNYAMSRSWGVLLPQASVFYVHEFDDDSRTLTSSFVEDPGSTSLNYQTDEPDRNYFTAGIGATAVLANGIMPFVDYQALLGHDFLDEQVITIGVRVEL